MDKRTLFILLIFLLFLAACSSSSTAQAPNSNLPILALDTTATPSPSNGPTSPPSTTQAYIATYSANLRAFRATRSALMTQTEQYWQDLFNPEIRLSWTPAPTRTATPVTTKPATPSPTPIPVLSPALVLNNTNNPLWAEMQSKGYNVYDTASFTYNGYLYSAYIFLSPDPDPTTSRLNLDKETWILAFYLWNGNEDQLLGTAYGKAYNNETLNGTYPNHYAFVDWDTPFLGWEFSFFIDPETTTRAA
ncbi:MAG: hypothetical protein JXB38_19195 [Anaerolineales bacterium]|nr:hypothetical protein [Anaerolineales bacterium]